MARSKVAEDLRQSDREAAVAMTPEERLQLAFDLGRRALDLYMEAHQVDYATAAGRLRKMGQSGRRYSRCMDEEAR